MTIPYWQKTTHEAVKSLGLAVTANQVTTLTLVPAGHVPGHYMVTFHGLIRQVGSAGALTRTLAYTANGGLAVTSTSGSVGVSPVGSYFLATTVSMFSDGSAPITASLNANGTVAGSLVVDIVGQAMFLGT